MKAPFIIVADFEALIKCIPENRRERTSCTEKTDEREACGCAYTVVRSDGESEPNVKYRQGVEGQKNAVEEFLERILEVEKRLRESMRTPTPISITNNDWMNFNNAKDCHICNGSLVKPEFQKAAN